MRCPKCESENKVIAEYLFAAFECRDCEHIFTKPELVRDKKF